jgi:hypothetical protein
MSRTLPLMCLLLGCSGEPSQPAAEGRYASRQQVFTELLAEIDADGNGRVEAAEYQRFDPQGSFELYDTNGDGAWSLGELEAALMDADPAALKMHGPGPGGQGGHGGRGGPGQGGGPRPGWGGGP